MRPVCRAFTLTQYVETRWGGHSHIFVIVTLLCLLLNLVNLESENILDRDGEVPEDVQNTLVKKQDYGTNDNIPGYFGHLRFGVLWQLLGDNWLTGNCMTELVCDWFLFVFYLSLSPCWMIGCLVTCLVTSVHMMSPGSKSTKCSSARDEKTKLWYLSCDLDQWFSN